MRTSWITLLSSTGWCYCWGGVLVSLASYFQGVSSQAKLTTVPVNMVSLQGVPLQLNCAARTTQVPVSWYDYSQGIREVSLNHENFYKKFYTIGGIPPVYNLQIHKLKMTSGGQYACIGGQEYQYVEVVVLEADPLCWTNVSDDGISVSGDRVEMTCSVTYSASSEKWAPRVDWFAPDGAEFSANYTDSDYNRPSAVFNSSVVIDVTPKLDGALLNTDIYFRAPLGQKDGFATNDPNYNFAWYSRPLNVQFPPQDIQICPDEESYLPGSTILCFGSSKPLSSYRWVDLASNQTVPGQHLQVPEYLPDGENRYRYKCVASNVIRGKKQTAESHEVNFTVVSNNKPKDYRVLVLSGVIVILAVLLLFMTAGFIGYCRRRKRADPAQYRY